MSTRWKRERLGGRVRVKILRMCIEIIFEWTIFDTRNRNNFLTVKDFKVYYCFFSYSPQPYLFLRDFYRNVRHVYFSKRPSFTLSFTSINRVFINSNFSVIKTPFFTWGSFLDTHDTLDTILSGTCQKKLITSTP